MVFDSGDFLDKKAAELGIYDDARSRDKGVEPEGVELFTLGGRTIAAIGLERTLKGSVALYDITDPANATFLDMLVTDGDLAPEGLEAFEFNGKSYLAIANEVSKPLLYILLRQCLSQKLMRCYWLGLDCLVIQHVVENHAKNI